MNTEKTKVLRIFENKIARKIHEHVKEGKSRTKTNTETMRILQEEDNVQFIKSIVIREYCCIDTIQNKKMPKQIARVQWKK
jgi:hypothetical protein